MRLIYTLGIINAGINYYSLGKKIKKIVDLKKWNVFPVFNIKSGRWNGWVKSFLLTTGTPFIGKCIQPKFEPLADIFFPVKSSIDEPNSANCLKTVNITIYTS